MRAVNLRQANCNKLSMKIELERYVALNVIFLYLVYNTIQQTLFFKDST